MEDKDIEAELSYAYLHAVASQAGIACQGSMRAHDNLGIDVTLSTARDFGPGAVLTDVTLFVQLKATIKAPQPTPAGLLPYWLDGVEHYDSLRAPDRRPPIILAVLFLPKEREQWLTHSPERLALQRCAYWMSLAGAPESENTSGKTVYLPEHQVLSPQGLEGLFGRIARLEDLTHAP